MKKLILFVIVALMSVATFAQSEEGITFESNEYAIFKRLDGTDSEYVRTIKTENVNTIYVNLYEGVIILSLHKDGRYSTFKYTNLKSLKPKKLKEDEVFLSGVDSNDILTFFLFSEDEISVVDPDYIVNFKLW